MNYRATYVRDARVAGDGSRRGRCARCLGSGSYEMSECLLAGVSLFHGLSILDAVVNIRTAFQLHNRPVDERIMRIRMRTANDSLAVLLERKVICGKPDAA